MFVSFVDLKEDTSKPRTRFRPGACSLSAMRAAFFLLAALLVAGCDRPPPAEEAVVPLWTAFGLQVRDLPESAREALGVTHGVMVLQVREPANRTRILPGDVIVAVDRRQVQNAEEFGRMATQRRDGAAGLLVRRTDADLFIAVEPVTRAARGAPPPPSSRGKPLRT